MGQLRVGLGVRKRVLGYHVVVGVTSGWLEVGLFGDVVQLLVQAKGFGEG